MEIWPLIYPFLIYAIFCFHCGIYRESRNDGASFIRVTRIGELGTTLAVTSNQRTLRSSCHPDEGGAKFLRNVASYKRHTT
jgi:hypothetical protein